MEWDWNSLIFSVEAFRGVMSACFHLPLQKKLCMQKLSVRTIITIFTHLTPVPGHGWGGWVCRKRSILAYTAINLFIGSPRFINSLNGKSQWACCGSASQINNLQLTHV